MILKATEMAFSYRIYKSINHTPDLNICHDLDTDAKAKIALKRTKYYI